jgi:hypothetical protein
MIPSQISYNLNGPPDAAKHQRYLRAVKRIKEIDPNCSLPDERDTHACERAEQILNGLTRPIPSMPSEADREAQYTHDLQNEVSVMLQLDVERGLVKREDFPFPERGCQDRLLHLRDMKNRLLEARAEMSLSPDAKFKRLESEFRAFRMEALSRISALEQELARP